MIHSKPGPVHFTEPEIYQLVCKNEVFGVGGMLVLIKEWRSKRARIMALKKFRKTSAELGYDLSMLSDDEIEKGALKVWIAFSQAGLSADEAAKAFRLFGVAAKKER